MGCASPHIIHIQYTLPLNMFCVYEKPDTLCLIVCSHLSALYSMFNFQCLQCLYLPSFSYNFSLFSSFVETLSGFPELITP